MSDSVRPHRRQPTRLLAISFSNAWKWKVKVKSLSRVQLFATPWTAAYQAPPSMGFSRQEYWSRVPLPSPARPGCNPAIASDLCNYVLRPISNSCFYMWLKTFKGTLTILPRRNFSPWIIDWLLSCLPMLSAMIWCPELSDLKSPGLLCEGAVMSDLLWLSNVS